MNALQPVTLVTPDGVSRELRDTPGARKAIYDKYGESNIQTLLARGDFMVFEIAYMMMHDEEGEPPKGLTLKRFMNCTPTAATTEVLAAVMSAATNGVKPKNEIEALIQKSIGLVSGALQLSASESATDNSGGDTVGPNSTPESNDSASNSD
jgi:hypothetical protein